MRSVAIGAVIHNDTLTFAVREDGKLGKPILHQLGTPLDAVALLLKQRVIHKHDDAVIFLEAGATAGAVLEGIRERDKQSRDEIINGLSPAVSVADGGVQFADRRSELHYRLRERANQVKLFVPTTYWGELDAFRAPAKDGKIFSLSVEEVTAKLDRYPSLAVVAALAAIEVHPRGTPQRVPLDPYSRASLARGHDPLKR